MIVAECNPNEINIRLPEKNRCGENFIITVNHFTTEKMKKYDASDGNTYFSDERYKTAYEALKNLEYNDAIEHAKSILTGKEGFMCQYDKSLNFDTVCHLFLMLQIIKYSEPKATPLRQNSQKIKG
jgi:predicted choloylglycine hydrolase